MSVIINNVTLEAVAARPEQYPEGSLPEIAFAGRSNVGKSSLINCMINRKALARTSAAPGKTRTINFYNVEDRLRFVDLPGYGYAKASKTESEKWGAMIERYLVGRAELRAIALLVDIRHAPSANDVLMIDWIRHYGRPFIVVCTKADKIGAGQLAKHVRDIRAGLKLAEADATLAFSSAARRGRDELWTLFGNYLSETLNFSDV